MKDGALEGLETAPRVQASLAMERWDERAPEYGDNQEDADSGFRESMLFFKITVNYN